MATRPRRDFFEDPPLVSTVGRTHQGLLSFHFHRSLGLIIWSTFRGNLGTPFHETLPAAACRADLNISGLPNLSGAEKDRAQAVPLPLELDTRQRLFHRTNATGIPFATLSLFLPPCVEGQIVAVVAVLPMPLELDTRQWPFHRINATGSPLATHSFFLPPCVEG